MKSLSKNFAFYVPVLGKIIRERDELFHQHKDLLERTKRIENKSRIFNYVDAREKEPIKIAFIFQNAYIWPSWHSIWYSCMKDNQIKGYMILTPFYHENSSLKIYDQSRDFLLKENIPFFYAESFSLERFKPHVVFLQNPYDDTRPEHFSSKEIIKQGARIAYIPYGLEVGGGDLNLRYQFNLDTQKMAWRVFARSYRHQRMFGKYCLSGNGHVVVTGHPKIDWLLSQEKINAKEIDQKPIGGRKVILWTPHFSVGNPPKWSTFELYHNVIIEAVKNNPNLFLLLRPHPLFFNSMKRNAIWDYDEEMTFINEIKKCENMALDIDSSYHFAFSISDALMTDAGSFLLEYLPTEKPILYLHHPKGYGLNDEIEIIKDNYYIAKNSEDIIHYFDMISKNNDPKKQKRINIINEALFSTDGKSGERILDHIKRSLYQEKSNGFPVELQNSISHQKSYKYWVENECTYLAPKDFYDKQETALRKFMRSIKRVDHALDIGCGDGKFTFIVSAKAKSTIAFDVSAKLIAKAKENAKEMNIKNVTFFADSIENAMNLGSYDLISCMGVTSCIIDDSCLIRFLDRLKQMAKPNSYLILKDTLSLDYNKIISDQNYIAKYRNIDDYLSAFFNRNFKLLKEQTLAINKEKNFVNRLLLLRQMGDVT